MKIDDIDNINASCNDDASQWAKEFCKRYPMALCQIEGTEGAVSEDEFEHIMTGWFANAIETACDYRAKITTLSNTER
jgi:hypothetical protein